MSACGVFQTNWPELRHRKPGPVDSPQNLRKPVVPNKVIQADSWSLEWAVWMVLDGVAKRDDHRQFPVVGKANSRSRSLRVVQCYRTRADAFGVGGEHHVLRLAANVEQSQAWLGCCERNDCW